MKKLAMLVSFALTLGIGAFSAARAATVQPYQQAAFDAAQKTGEPILIFVEASWCSVCAVDSNDAVRAYRT
jgi:thioredoxin 1